LFQGVIAGPNHEFTLQASFLSAALLTIATKARRAAAGAFALQQNARTIRRWRMGFHGLQASGAVHGYILAANFFTSFPFRLQNILSVSPHPKPLSFGVLSSLQPTG
jgi:hypothetical protein